MTDALHLKSPTIQFYPDGRMDAKNTASYAGFSPKTLAMMRCNGTGPHFIKRGRIFYFRDDVDAWIRSARFISTAQAATHHQLEADQQQPGPRKYLIRRDA